MERSGRATSRTVVLVAIVAVAAGLYLGRSLLIPVAMAVLLSLLLSPLCALLERWGLPRVPAVIVVVLILLVAVSGLGYVLADQVSSLAERLPTYKERFREKITRLNRPVGSTFGRVYETIEELSRELRPAAREEGAVKVEVVEPPRPGGGVLRVVADAFASTLGAAAVVSVLVLFLLIFRSDVRDRLILLFGVHRVNLTTQTMDEAARSVSRYLLMLACVNTLHGLAMTAGLLVIGVPQAILWGCLAALLRFIPYVGPWVSAALPITLCLGVFPSLTPALMVLAFVIALELVSNNVLEPWLYAGRTGLTPLAVVVAAVFWAWLWGGMGLLLAVPLTVSLAVLGRHVPSLRFLNTLLGSDVRLEPHVCVYHRLLGRGPEEAARILETCGAGVPPESAYDDLIVRALALAEQDRQAGTLDDERFEAFRQGARDLIEDLPAPDSADARRGGVRVLCMPAGGALDDIATELLAHLLSGDGYRVETMGAASAGEKAERVASEQADIAVVVTLPPPNVLRVRGLCKWLRRRFPDLEIVVALLDGSEGPSDLRSRLGLEGRSLAVGRLSAVRRRVGEVAVPLLSARGA